MSDRPASDYDSAWKEAVTLYFEPFMEFCFPQIYSDIDWEKGYETIDTDTVRFEFVVALQRYLHILH